MRGEEEIHRGDLTLIGTYALLVCCGVLTLPGCITTRGASPGARGHTQKRAAARAYLRVDVRPKTASIYVDERYQGEVHRWSRQTLVLPAGVRRVELRAAGYMSQRFDVPLTAERITVLRVRMERTLGEWSTR